MLILDIQEPIGRTLEFKHLYENFIYNYESFSNNNFYYVSRVLCWSGGEKRTFVHLRYKIWITHWDRSAFEITESYEIMEKIQITEAQLLKCKELKGYNK